ncbi:hypothetical protein VPH47_16720 [Stenotrophomonas sp. WED208]|uniref:hypothetical protein n=1 Tax=Stenotrophomonas sp. WED208 TaxID=3112800 RepID=UPI0034D784F0
MKAQKTEQVNSIEFPSLSEIQVMERLGMEPGAVGYDDLGRLVRRLPDGELEVLPGVES